MLLYIAMVLGKLPLIYTVFRATETRNNCLKLVITVWRVVNDSLVVSSYNLFKKS